jgi:hypothetical protein
MINKEIKIGIIIIIGILFSITILSAYSRYVPAYTFGHQTADLLGTQGFPIFDRSMCSADKTSYYR